MRSDAELMRAARKDPAAFREVYDRYAGRIHAFALRRTGDFDAAHDLTAETFAQAWLSRRRFRDRDGRAERVVARRRPRRAARGRAASGRAALRRRPRLRPGGGCARHRSRRGATRGRAGRCGSGSRSPR